jgi:hypothetical protein
MARSWASVLAAALGWVVAASCSLDIGEVLHPSKDAGSGDTGSDGNDSGVYVLPPGCLNAAKVIANCDPRTNAGCPVGLGCDTTFYTQPELACLPNDNIPQGGACSLNGGPYCAPKLTCSGAPGVCVPFCCTGADCSSGVCIPFDFNLGSLGFCKPTSSDAGADASG